jgi:hypothetical protein
LNEIFCYACTSQLPKITQTFNWCLKLMLLLGSVGCLTEKKA